MIESMYNFLEKIGYVHPLHFPWTHIPMGLVLGASNGTLSFFQSD